MFKKTILPNNLRVITAPMKETKAVTLYLVIKTGSRYETKEQNGISHFLEHMFFKGTKKRPSTLIIAKELDNIGANYNAFTSEEMTGFYIQAESSKFSLTSDILFDILENSLFESKEINKEKRVIIEEYNMRRDTPMAYVFDLYKQLLYGDTSLGRLVVGDPNIIKSFSKKDFIGYKNKFYLPSNIVLAAAGSFNTNDVALIKHYGSRLQDDHVNEFMSIIDTQTKPQSSVYFKKTDQAHLVLGYRSVPRNSSLRYIQEVLNVVLGASMSSRLFIEVREKRGLAYHISSDTWYFSDSGSLIAYAGVPIPKTKQAIKLILEEFVKIKEKGVSLSELKRAKDYLKGRMALRMESSYNCAAFLADQALLLNKVRTPEEELKEIEKVSQDDIMQFAREIIKPEKLNLITIGPFEKKEEFEKILS